jgi:hypothetical protein
MDNVQNCDSYRRGALVNSDIHYPGFLDAPPDSMHTVLHGISYENNFLVRTSRVQLLSSFVHFLCGSSVWLILHFCFVSGKLSPLYGRAVTSGGKWMPSPYSAFTSSRLSGLAWWLYCVGCTLFLVSSHFPWSAQKVRRVSISGLVLTLSCMSRDTRIFVSSSFVVYICTLPPPTPVRDVEFWRWELSRNIFGLWRSWRVTSKKKI